MGNQSGTTVKRSTVALMVMALGFGGSASATTARPRTRYGLRRRTRHYLDEKCESAGQLGALLGASELLGRRT